MRFEAGGFGQPECRLDDGRALSDLVDEQNASRGEAPAATPEMDRLIRTIWRLRQADGCPWDREQTHRSITKNMVEEAYEAVDAIEQHDSAHLREELGDVLLQVVLQAQMAADAGEFTIDDVCADVNEKMLRRHPHVFGALAVEDAHEVNDVWEQVKAQERAAAQGGDVPWGSLLDAVPSGFPALMQAQKISKKAVAAGFEWETLDDVWAKVREEVGELNEAYEQAPHDAKGRIDGEAHPVEYEAAQLELGDVLFTLVNVGRKMGLDAESALRATCVKFRQRWRRMERQAADNRKSIEECSTDELLLLWASAKSHE